MNVVGTLIFGETLTVATAHGTSKAMGRCFESNVLL